MSLLIYNLDPDGGVDVFTDTEAVTFDKSRIVTDVRKAHGLPHLGMISATTGIGSLDAGWVAFLNNLPAGTSIDEVGPIAAKVMRSLLGQLEAENGCSAPSTSTVHLFGWSRAAARFVGSLHHCAYDFEPVEIGPGAAAKPLPTDLDEFLDLVCTAGVVDLAEYLRVDHAARPDGIHIGGELVHLDLDRTELTESVVHRFENYSTSSPWGWNTATR